MAQRKILCPNDNVQNNSWEKYERSYITFIRLPIIKSIATDHTFSSCTSTELYTFTHENVFAPAYLSGYPIKVTLYQTPDNVLQTNLVTKYTSACQYAPHNIVRFYIILLLYILIFFTLACHMRKIYQCMSTRSTWHHTILHNPTILHTKTFVCKPVTCARRYCLRQNCHSLFWYIHTRLTHHFPLQNMIQIHIQVETFPFFIL